MMFFRSFRRHIRLLSRKMREQWSRDLPPQDLMTDRWERAQELGFGEGSSIYASTYVYGDVCVGKNVWIGPNAVLDGTGGLTIGDGCAIGACSQIYTHDSSKRCVSEGKCPLEKKPVRIGKHTHISPQVFIAKGVAIGDHCIIGACSFVNADIPPYSVAFGNPCRVVSRIHVERDGTTTMQKIS